MCDYSLHHVKSRPAKVGDKLKDSELQHWYSRVCCAGGFHNGGVRSSGNGACFF